jgi:hypothetical protein
MRRLRTRRASARAECQITTAQHKTVKSLKKRDNLRDSMSIVELALTSLAEATATEVHRERGSYGFGELQGDAQRAGGIAGETRRKIEAELGRPVVTGENYKALIQAERQPSLFDDTGDQG